MEGDLIRHCELTGWSGVPPRCPDTCKPSADYEYHIYMRNPDQSVFRTSAVPDSGNFSILCPRGLKPSQDVNMDLMFSCAGGSITQSGDEFRCAEEITPYPRFLMPSFYHAFHHEEFYGLSGVKMIEYHTEQSGQFDVETGFSWFTLVYITSLNERADFITWNPSPAEDG